MVEKLEEDENKQVIHLNEKNNFFLTTQRNNCRVKQKSILLFCDTSYNNEKDQVICELCQKVFENQTKLKEHDKQDHMIK